MSVEAWRVIAERFGRKYGVEIHLGGSQVYSDGKSICLPRDIPDRMQETLHGLLLHEKEHIVQGDFDFAKGQEQLLVPALELLNDIHNDNLIREEDPGYVGLCLAVQEYIDTKVPRAFLEQIDWHQKAALELLNRSRPKELTEGRSFTKDPKVRHFFKVNRKKVGKLLRVMMDLRLRRDDEVRWARWLMEDLFKDVAQKAADDKGIPMPGGGSGQPDPNAPSLPQGVIDAITEFIKKMGGLVPPKMTNDFECVSPGDLVQKVPEAVTVQQLKQFLTEQMDKVVVEETGAIDPAMLPQYQTAPDELYQQERSVINKKVRVYLLLDASGSMREPLEGGHKKYEALVRATGLVCQAADKIIREDGLDIAVEAWAFGESDRLIKTGSERWDPYTFKQRYWRGSGDGATRVRGLLKTIADMPEDEETKSVVLLITDGQMDAQPADIDEAMSSGQKRWLLLGIGDGIPDTTHFRFVAKSLEEIEYILCQTVKEAVK